MQKKDGNRYSKAMLKDKNFLISTLNYGKYIQSINRIVNALHKQRGELIQGCRKKMVIGIQKKC